MSDNCPKAFPELKIRPGPCRRRGSPGTSTSKGAAAPRTGRGAMCPRQTCSCPPLCRDQPSGRSGFPSGDRNLASTQEGPCKEHHLHPPVPVSVPAPLHRRVCAAPERCSSGMRKRDQKRRLSESPPLGEELPWARWRPEERDTGRKTREAPSAALPPSPPVPLTGLLKQSAPRGLKG